MHKLKKPCECTHRAGKHKPVYFKVEPMTEKGRSLKSFYTRETRTQKPKNGACAVEGCLCPQFKQRLK